MAKQSLLQLFIYFSYFVWLSSFKADWTAHATFEFQRFCRMKLLVGVVDEYIDGVLHLFLCDTSSDEDIYFHNVLRQKGHAQICKENIPSKVEMGHIIGMEV